MNARTHIATAAVCAALQGCTLPASLGNIQYDATPGDAPPDAGALDAHDALEAGDGIDADATFDASDAAQPDASDAGDAGAPGPELTGLDSNSPVFSADGDQPASHYRLYYRGGDGTLWMERRDGETHARRCQASLGAPADPDLVLAGQPAVMTPIDVVVAPVRRRSTGALELWSIEQLEGVGAACGHIFSAWTRVASPPAPFEMASAPAGTTAGLGAGGRAWMAVTSADGTVLYTSRATSPLSAWDRWYTLSPFASGERPIARPALAEQRGGGSLQVWLVVRRPSGAHSIRSNIVATESPRDLGYWLTLEGADDPPATGLAVIDDLSIGLWVGYVGRSSHVWAIVFTKIAPGQVNWTEWRDLHPVGARASGVPAIGFRRNWRSSQNEAALLTAPPGAPRELYFAVTLGGVWSTQSTTAWPAAPDGLQ